MKPLSCNTKVCAFKFIEMEFGTYPSSAYSVKTKRRSSHHNASTTSSMVESSFNENKVQKDTVESASNISPIDSTKDDPVAQCSSLSTSHIPDDDNDSKPASSSFAEAAITNDEEACNDVPAQSEASILAPASYSLSWFHLFSRSKPASDASGKKENEESKAPFDQFKQDTSNDTITATAASADGVQVFEQTVSKDVSLTAHIDAKGNVDDVISMTPNEDQSAPPDIANEGAVASGISIASIPDSEAPRTSSVLKDAKDLTKDGESQEGWFGWWPWINSPALVTSDSDDNDGVKKVGDADRKGGDEGGKAGESGEQESEGQTLTEAEKVMKAALAREIRSPPPAQGSNPTTDETPGLISTASVTSTKDDTTTTATKPDNSRALIPTDQSISNPKSVSTHLDASSDRSILMPTAAVRTSWVSFFASSSSLKSLNKRKVQAESKRIDRPKEEAEEVMTVDFEEGRAPMRDAGEDGEAKDGGKVVKIKDADTNSVDSIAVTEKANSNKCAARSLVVQAAVNPKLTGGPSRPIITPEPPRKRPQPPITDSNKAKKDLSGIPVTSSAASTRSSSPTPPSARRPSLILPTFEDTFDLPPRSVLPTHLRIDRGKGKGKSGASALFKSSVGALSSYLLGVDIDVEELEKKKKAEQMARAHRSRVASKHNVSEMRSSSRAEITRKGLRVQGEEIVWLDRDGEEIGVNLPRHLKVLWKSMSLPVKESWVNGKSKATPIVKDVITEPEKRYLKGCKNIVVIGVHGWFPGALMRSVIGAVSDSLGYDYPLFLSRIAHWNKCEVRDYDDLSCERFH